MPIEDAVFKARDADSLAATFTEFFCQNDKEGPQAIKFAQPFKAEAGSDRTPTASSAAG